MITKEQAQAILAECGDPNCQTTECELATTVIDLWDRAKKMEEGIAEIVGECGCSTARAILKETTHDA